jgi:putative transposase
VQEGINLHRVLRYVERNAVAAELSARAEDWRWGSASQRLRNCDRPKLRAIELLPSEDWLRYLNEPTPSPDIAYAIRRNLPLGDEAWVQRRREALGLPEPGRRGRPCKA